jgi:hypothetical protein
MQKKKTQKKEWKNLTLRRAWFRLLIKKPKKKWKEKKKKWHCYKPKKKKIKKKKEERQHTLRWEEKRMLDLGFEGEREEKRKWDIQVCERIWEKKIKPWYLMVQVFYFSFYWRDYRKNI